MWLLNVSLSLTISANYQRSSFPRVNIPMALLILKFFKSPFSDSDVLFTVFSVYSLANIFTSRYEYFWMILSIQAILPVIHDEA